MSSATYRRVSNGLPLQRPCIKSGCAASFCLVGELEPVTGHAEEEDPAVHVADVLGKFDAVGGIEAVTGNGFPTHRHPPDIRPLTCLLT